MNTSCSDANLKHVFVNQPSRKHYAFQEPLGQMLISFNKMCIVNQPSPKTIPVSRPLGQILLSSKHVQSTAHQRPLSHQTTERFSGRSFEMDSTVHTLQVSTQLSKGLSSHGTQVHSSWFAQFQHAHLSQNVQNLCDTGALQIM